MTGPTTWEFLVFHSHSNRKDKTFQRLKRFFLTRILTGVLLHKKVLILSTDLPGLHRASSLERLHFVLRLCLTLTTQNSASSAAWCYDLVYPRDSRTGQRPNPFFLQSLQMTFSLILLFFAAGHDENHTIPNYLGRKSCQMYMCQAK